MSAERLGVRTHPVCSLEEGGEGRGEEGGAMGRRYRNPENSSTV